MTTLRRLLRLPRFPFRIYILILGLFLLFAYIVTGPAHRFFAKLHPTLGSFYEPKDLQREEFEKTILQEKR